MFGTVRIENLPITLRGITVLQPAPSQAPWIPEPTNKANPVTLV